jgi:uncharacterized protein YjlB
MTEIQPEALSFADDGAVPNNPLPLLLWRGAVEPQGPDPAAAFERRFAANGWPPSWRNGVYAYVHFHTNTHETLGIAAGRVRVRLGGSGGAVVELKAGDVVLIPAGVGHENLGASDDLLVVGAYPPGVREDLLRDASDDIEARARIAAVPRPARDPVNGKALWADRR